VHDRAPVVVDAPDAIAARLRIEDELDVPVLLDERRLRARCDVVRPGLVEFAEFVGRVDDLFAVVREGIHVVRYVAFVLGDQLRRVLLRREVDEIYVRIRAGARLDERQVAVVRRQLRELPGRVVPEDERALIVLDRVAVQIERLCVALVRRHEEMLLVGGPADELGFDLLAGRQVARLAVRFAHVEVIDLVAAAVRGEQRAWVCRKPGDGKRGIGGRGCQRLLAFACGRQPVHVIDAGLVRGDEQLLVVGRPCVALRHDVRRRSEESFGVVLGRRGQGRGWGRRRRRRCAGFGSRVAAGEQ
jgi:hypothetical protein